MSDGKQLTKDQQKVWDRLKEEWKKPFHADNAYTTFTGAVPVNPIIGTAYYDNTLGRMFVYDGKAWLMMK